MQPLINRGARKTPCFPRHAGLGEKAMFGTLIRRKPAPTFGDDLAAFESTTFSLSTAVPRPTERRADDRLPAALSIIKLSAQSGEDRAALSRQSGCDRVGEPSVDSVREAGYAAAVADDLPVSSPRDHVHPSPTEQRPLIEAVAWSTGSPQLDDRRDDRSLWGCSTQRKLEQNRFAEVAVTEPLDPRRNAQSERCTACGAGDLHERLAHLADAWGKNAVIERLEPHAAPPQAPDGQRETECGNPPPLLVDRHGGDCGGDRDGERPPVRRPGGERSGQSQAQRPNEHVRREPIEEPHVHGATSSRSCSSRAGPMPGIASRSSMELNAPCCAR